MPELSIPKHAHKFNMKEMSAAEDSNFPRFIAEFRRIALLPPSSLTLDAPGMFISGSDSVSLGAFSAKP